MHILEKNDNETILEFFIKNCDKNGFNVSKIIAYLEYIDTYLKEIIKENDNNISEELVYEIFDFGNYFFENYGQETREKRFLTFGVNDAYVLSLYFEISRESCLEEYEEKYNALTSLEQRKIKRVTKQLLSFDGKIAFVLLEVDEETEEDLPPLIIPYSKDMSDEERTNVEEIINMETLDMFLTKGIIICVIEKDEKKLTKNECKVNILGVAFKDKEIGLISAQKLVSTFSSIDENFQELLGLDSDEEIEFVDADVYINPFGMTRNEYNQLGEKLPNRKGRKMNDNIIPFSSIVKKKK